MWFHVNGCFQCLICEDADFSQSKYLMSLLFLQMFSRLLGLLVLSSLCSAMLLPNYTKMVSTEEDGSAMDPNTFYRLGPDEGEMSPVSRSNHLHGPHIGQPWGSTENITDASDEHKLRMLAATGPGMPPMPDMAICDMLMNTLPPPSPDKIPYFCLCSRCKGTQGPKGDQGDRGPTGMYIA